MKSENKNKQIKNLIHRVKENILKSASDRLECAGVSLNCHEVHVIDAIGHADYINITCVAKSLGITKSGASQIVNKLKHLGLITKSVSCHSNKEYSLELTSMGFEIYNLNHKIHQKSIKAVNNKLATYSESEKKIVIEFLEILSGRE